MLIMSFTQDFSAFMYLYESLMSLTKIKNVADIKNNMTVYFLVWVLAANIDGFKFLRSDNSG